MAKSESGEQQSKRSTAPPPRPAVFKAPDSFTDDHGVIADTEYHTQGVVKPENVRKLLDSFGLADKTDISFPFQHMRKKGEEIWSLRIEGPAHHNVNGEHVIGHQWQYRRERPELVGSVQ